MQLNNPNLWFVCKFCNRAFPEKERLIAHKRREHGEKLKVERNMKRLAEGEVCRGERNSRTGKSGSWRWKNGVLFKYKSKSSVTKEMESTSLNVPGKDVRTHGANDGDPENKHLGNNLQADADSGATTIAEDDDHNSGPSTKVPVEAKPETNSNCEPPLLGPIPESEPIAEIELGEAILTDELLSLFSDENIELSKTDEEEQLTSVEDDVDKMLDMNLNGSIPFLDDIEDLGEESVTDIELPSIAIDDGCHSPCPEANDSVMKLKEVELDEDEDCLDLEKSTGKPLRESVSENKKVSTSS